MAEANQPAEPRAPSRSSAKTELGRGERVLPGVFRLRLPLPWPGVPHCNAWAVAAGDGVVLFDTGMHQLPAPHRPGSLSQLERALSMCGLVLEDVRLLVCTHAHADHYGQAATIVERTGCELLLHPNHGHMLRSVEDPEAALERRIEVARQSGVPEEPLRRYAADRSALESGIAGVVEPDRPLIAGVVVETDLGPWMTYETPGHCPSHVCLFQTERRLLISGDHLLGRISQFFEYGSSPDPVGEFLGSLDVVEALDARLCLPGHGRTFADVQTHIDGNRRLVVEHLERTLAQLGRGEPLTPFEILPLVFGETLSRATAPWRFIETLGLLAHLEATGQARLLGSEPDRWTVA